MSEAEIDSLVNEIKDLKNEMKDLKKEIKQIRELVKTLELKNYVNVPGFGLINKVETECDYNMHNGGVVLFSDKVNRAY